jgi:DEAD/DEAH box helicase domain-containing protein
MLRITEKVVSYDKKRTYDNVRISNHPLDLPEHIFETEGLWFVLNDALKDVTGSRKFDLGGIIHAVEHAVIACMPLFSLCDRGDVGGLSHTCFPLFGLPAIFIYDGHEGGIGLSRRAYDIFEELLETTLKVLDECPCTDGCPSCVQDPQCGNRNEPLDKQGARFLIRNWLKIESSTTQSRGTGYA